MNNRTPPVVQLLRDLRAYLILDREVLHKSHVNRATGRIEDQEGIDAIDVLDELTGRIDVVVAELTQQ